MPIIVLLAFQRALTVLVSLVILLSLIALLVPRAQLPTGESGPSGAGRWAGRGSGAGPTDPFKEHLGFNILLIGNIILFFG